MPNDINCDVCLTMIPFFRDPPPRLANPERGKHNGVNYGVVKLELLPHILCIEALERKLQRTLRFLVMQAANTVVWPTSCTEPVHCPVVDFWAVGLDFKRLISLTCEKEWRLFVHINWTCLTIVLTSTSSYSCTLVTAIRTLAWIDYIVQTSAFLIIIIKNSRFSFLPCEVHRVASKMWLSFLYIIRSDMS